MQERSPGVALPGLPEGVEAVRYGVTKEGEFCFTGDALQPIQHAGNGYIHHGIIVEPAEGYAFAWQEPPGSVPKWVAVKTCARRIIQATFQVTNAVDESSVQVAIRKLPGYHGSINREAADPIAYIGLFADIRP